MTSGTSTELPTLYGPTVETGMQKMYGVLQCDIPDTKVLFMGKL